MAPKEKELIGWIAMDEDGDWYFYLTEPRHAKDEEPWWTTETGNYKKLCNYNPKTKPENWKESKQPVYI